MAHADAGVIFAKGYIQDPVDPILNLPMGADRMDKQLDLIGDAGNVVPLLNSDFPLEVAFWGGCQGSRLPTGL